MPQRRGKLDATSYAYVLGGIPGMAGFFWLLFLIVRFFDWPA